KIVAGLIREHEGRRVPVILFTKGGGQWLESLANTGADCLGLDWATDLGQARARVGHQGALQGHMGPTAHYASHDWRSAEGGALSASYGAGRGHIFKLGHGSSPEVDPEQAGAFIRAVHELSAQYHS